MRKLYHTTVVFTIFSHIYCLLGPHFKEKVLNRNDSTDQCGVDTLAKIFEVLHADLKDKLMEFYVFFIVTKSHEKTKYVIGT